jgi:hypothetical protein
MLRNYILEIRCGSLYATYCEDLICFDNLLADECLSELACAFDGRP